ncbi:hypothetical protein D3C75_809540 [compost metagenome]
MRGHVLNHRHDRVQHHRAVTILAYFAVHGQAHRDVCHVLEAGGRDERWQHARAVKALGQLPRQALFLQFGLHIAQGEVQRRGVTGNGVQHLFLARMSRQRLAQQHGNFRLIVHRATLDRNLEAALGRHHAAARLDEQQRFGGDRVVQLLGMLGIVTADAHHLAQREVNACAVYVLVLVTHGRLLWILLSIQVRRSYPDS